MIVDPRIEADKFLAVNDRYRKVGALDTEQFHPKTRGLAEWARDDLPRAYQSVKDVDMDALGIVVREHGGHLEKMRRAIWDTLNDGGDIITKSMGSPYRESIVHNHIWSQLYKGTPMASRLRAYGTGGDVSLMVPVKGVEDHPEYGARIVRESGLRANDMLFGYVEGGETPSVIGGIEEALRLSHRNAHFAYANPDEQLYKIPDVAAVHDNPRIDRYSLAVGPMALAGSTRMQATTVLGLVIGAALFNLSMDAIKRFVDYMNDFDYSRFVEFTEAEHDVYNKGEYTLYRAREYAVRVGSNHTELCPTFNLAPFDDPASLTYLSVIGARDHDEAYRFYTGRDANLQEWIPGGIAGRERYDRLDISEGTGEPKRRARVPGPMHDFNILQHGDVMRFDFKGIQHDVPVAGMHPLFQSLLLKMILNTHTTLLMGRMGKYEQNMMSYVNAMLNYKLVDRGIRIIEEKFRREGLPVPDYNRTAYALFDSAAKSTGPDDPPVPKAFKALKLEMAS